MKNPKDILLLITGIVIFLLSYIYDNLVNRFFKNMRFPMLDYIFGIITNFAAVIIVILIIPIIALYRNKKRQAYLLFATFAASVAVAFIIKLIVLRQRPSEILYYPFFNVIDYSFPSMHAMIVFSLLPALFEYLPRQKNFWIFFAFIVSFTRIYFGLHFLSDVISAHFLDTF